MSVNEEQKEDEVPLRVGVPYMITRVPMVMEETREEWCCMMSYNDCKIIWTQIYILVVVFISTFTLGSVIYWLCYEPEEVDHSKDLDNFSDSDAMSSESDEAIFYSPSLDLQLLLMQILVLFIACITCILCCILGMIGYEYVYKCEKIMDEWDKLMEHMFPDPHNIVLQDLNHEQMKLI